MSNDKTNWIMYEKEEALTEDEKKELTKDMKFSTWEPERFDDSKEAAEEQWQWVKGLIESLGQKEFSIETLHYLYVTAFVRGWELGIEENTKDNHLLEALKNS